MVKFLIGKERYEADGQLEKENPKTVWVRLSNGDLVKRHRVKDQVKIIK